MNRRMAYRPAILISLWQMTDAYELTGRRLLRQKTSYRRFEATRRNTCHASRTKKRKRRRKEERIWMGWAAFLYGEKVMGLGLVRKVFFFFFGGGGRPGPG
ncbi:hypothetical protein F4809DRAFT_556245 [Biscogniauxia mediterranea]|nr:hypothetical protein F4809DRAFT_556245 [Biscogniauxia mediterranea]